MNRTRMLILAFVALALSAGVTYLTYRVLQTRLQPAEETVQVVAAAKRLTLGSRLTAEDVKLTAWPKGVVLEGSFPDPASVIGRAVIISMMPNEPILESKLAPREAGAGLAAVIPEGMRAISVSVNNVIGVAGFVAPGSRVDLILTGQPPPSVTTGLGKTEGGEGMAAKVVLENIQVLATGQNVQQDGSGQAQAVQVVTLLVTPEQAAKIALATGDGRIQLALRNALDLEKVDPPLVFRSALYTGATLEEPPKPVKVAVRPRTIPATGASAMPPPPPPPRVFEVELIRGIKRESEKFEEKKPEVKKP
jgi:pilus assembly protein CpaB